MEGCWGSRRFRTDDSLADLSNMKFSETDANFADVECTASKPDWLGSWGRFWLRKRELFVCSMSKKKREKWKFVKCMCCAQKDGGPTQTTFNTEYVNIQGTQELLHYLFMFHLLVVKCCFPLHSQPKLKKAVKEMPLSWNQRLWQLCR